MARAAAPETVLASLNVVGVRGEVTVIINELIKLILQAYTKNTAAVLVIT